MKSVFFLPTRCLSGFFKLGDKIFLKIKRERSILIVISKFKKIPEGKKILDPNGILDITTLPDEILKLISLSINNVVITRKALKHIVERRGKLANEIIESIPDILNNPTKIVDNSLKRPRSFLFAKKNGNIKGVILEITKPPEGNRVVSAFPIDRKTYEKMIDISGRAEFPPFASQRTGRSQQILSDVRNTPEPTIAKEKSFVKEKLLERIYLAFKIRLEKLPGEMNLTALKTIEKILSGDSKKQIPLLPYSFNSFLKIQKTNEEFLIKLGLANVFGWTAYTIFDDFFDQQGKTELLPVAIFCLREMDIIFQNILPCNPNFKNLVSRILDNSDAANFWEIVDCRSRENLPDYDDLKALADRSLGHALGPLAILFSLGFDPDSSEVENLVSFFRHLLIARQLNDDLFDRDDDLARNNISPVVSLTLKKSRKEAIEEINDLIFFHLQKAEEKTKKLLHICEKDFFDYLIEPVLKAAKETERIINPVLTN